MSTFSYDNITSNSVDVYVSGLSESYSYEIRLFVRRADDDKDVTYDETIGVSFTDSYGQTIDGLEPGTDYKINVSVSGEGWLGAEDFTTLSVERPETFEWWYEKTENDYFNLTADEWNDFTYRINEMREYLGLSSYSFTEAVEGENFTAKMYNQARKAIQGMGGGAGTYIPTVYSGDNITAYAMNVLVSELNSAIENL